MPTPLTAETEIHAAALARLRAGRNPFATQVATVSTFEQTVLADVPEFTANQLAELIEILGFYRTGKGMTRVYPLLGDRGAGKTHLLYCLRDRLRESAIESGEETLVVVVERLSPEMDAVDYLLWHLVNQLIATKGDGARTLGVIAGRITARLLGEALRGLSPPRRLELMPSAGLFNRLGFGRSARTQAKLAAIDDLIQSCDSKNPSQDELRCACDAAGVKPEVAIRAIENHLDRTESKDVVGWFRRELYARLAKIALLGDRAQFEDFHTGQFDNAPANVKNAGNLGRRLLDCWLELFSVLNMPVVVIFDQIEDYLHHHDQAREKASRQFFTDSLARFINELRTICILVFAEHAFWTDLIAPMTSFTRERLVQPIDLPGRPARFHIRMPDEIVPAILTSLIQRRIAIQFSDLDLTGLSPTFPFESSDLEKFQKETSIRDCLKQLAKRYDEIVHKPDGPEPHPKPRVELRQRLADLWKEKIAAVAKETGSDMTFRPAFIPEVQNAITGWLDVLFEVGLTGSGPWHKVELVTDTKKGQYGYLTVIRTEGPNDRGIGIAAWLGEGAARPNDLRHRIGFFKQNPCPIKTLILLRADGRSALNGDTATEYEKATKKDKRDIRVHKYEAKHLHALMAFAAWHQAAIAEVQTVKEADAAAEMIFRHFLADLSKELLEWVDTWRQPVPQSTLC